MAAADLTVARVRELVHYEPETGVLRWASKPNRRIRVGSPAGSLAFGYVVINIDGETYRAHRLAFLFMTGRFPTMDVDHINGNRADNRWVNLREASRELNMQNLRSTFRNKSSDAPLGVTWDKSRGKWKAAIAVNGRLKNLGRFESQSEAGAVYLAAKRRLHAGNTL